MNIGNVIPMSETTKGTPCQALLSNFQL